jgi:D-alanine-D-alanine ligase
LLCQLAYLARECWHGFGLRGYARVDFRVDQEGNPWILEINANPCLSPDAGFAAALERAGISFPQAVERLLDDALSG